MPIYFPFSFLFFITHFLFYFILYFFVRSFPFSLLILQKANAKDETFVRGSIVSFVDRLDDEFTRSLQNIDPHTTEYIDRLRDETGLYALIVRSQLYFEKINHTESLFQICMRRVEHLYYMVCKMMILHYNIFTVPFFPLFV